MEIIPAIMVGLTTLSLCLCIIKGDKIGAIWSFNCLVWVILYITK